MVKLYKGTKNFIPILLLTHYLFVSLLVTSFHTHEADLDFHDYCPACQWEIQAKDSDTTISAVWHILLNPIQCQFTRLEEKTLLYPQTISIENNSPRAPPAIQIHITI